MKKRFLVMLGWVLAATVSCTAALFASGPVSADRPNLNLGLIEENIAVGLKSGIPGVQADLAQLVRDLKDLYPDEEFSSLTIPLMAIMNDESAETPVRVIAALALDRLESAVGDYAISQLPRFTDNPRVQYICTALTVRRMKSAMPVGKEIAAVEPLPEFEE